MRAFQSLIIAFSTYSRIPMPKAEWTEENRRDMLCFFPLVGVAVGAALWLWLWLCETLSLGAVLRGAVGALLPLWVTSGIHMDGFMDTSDALASWQTKERRLEILKDSHVGAFAVMNCAAYLLLAAGLMSEATIKDAPLLGACFVFSRALSAWMATFLPSARPDGMLGSVTSSSQKRRVAISSMVYVALCALYWALLGGWQALLCLPVGVLCALYYRRMSLRCFGGVTGDLAGWFLQLAELCCIATVILGGKLR